MPAPTVHRLPNAPAAARAAAEHMAGRIRGDIARQGRCRLALAGGSTPRPVYERLAAPDLTRRIDWARTEIFWGDERSVPLDHPDSNYRMAEDALLKHLPVPPAGIHRIRSELPALEAAEDYERVLGDLPLDLVLLGMGDDGHTASLFPGRPEAAEGSRRVVAAEAPAPPHVRVTLTLRALAEAGAVCFIVTGRSKAARVAEVFCEIAAGSPRLPAARVRPGSGELDWFLDADAARNLPPNPEERSVP